MTEAECRALVPGDRVRNTCGASTRHGQEAVVVLRTDNGGRSVTVRYDGSTFRHRVFAWALERTAPPLADHATQLLDLFSGGSPCP